MYAIHHFTIYHRIYRGSFYYATSILRNMWKILIHHAYFTPPTIRYRRVLKTFYLLLPNMFFISTLKSHHFMYSTFLALPFFIERYLLGEKLVSYFVGYNFRQLTKIQSLLMVENFHPLLKFVTFNQKILP